MKSVLPMEIIKEIIKVMPSYRASKGISGARAAVHDEARIKGGNWSMQGPRRSSHVHDEDECQMSIAEFMGAQDRYEEVD